MYLQYEVLEGFSSTGDEIIEVLEEKNCLIFHYMMKVLERVEFL